MFILVCYVFYLWVQTKLPCVMHAHGLRRAQISTLCYNYCPSRQCFGAVTPLKFQTLFPEFLAELTRQTWAHTTIKGGQRTNS
jgi:hypothetical protein